MAETVSGPWLLVGLGNPGKKYAGNRHNIGFMVVEHWLERHGPPGATSLWRDKFHGRFAAVSGPPGSFGRVIVLEPQTFMNRSGKSVAGAAGFFDIPPERTIVVHDELDFPFGRIAIKNGGGHGGHNGLRDIIAALGSRDFVRLRTGIGRPTRGDVTSWVLADFDRDDAVELPDVVDRAQAAVTCVMTQGVTAAMNEFNQPPNDSRGEP
jgi:peptidyl-tRNA hydrolase, PTH1 family